MGHLSQSSVIGEVGGSVVHVAVNSQPVNDAKGDFLPLVVDYRARLSAFGIIPEGQNRKRDKTSDGEILVARFIDRAIRPLFPSGYVEDLQITVTNHAADGTHDPTVLAVNATSLALLRSRQPWFGPVGCVRVGMIDGKFVVNPPVKSFAQSSLDLLYAGTADRTLMIEAVGQQVPEDVMSRAIAVAHTAVKGVIDMQLSLLNSANSENSSLPAVAKKKGYDVKEEHKQLVHHLFWQEAYQLYRENHSAHKGDRSVGEGSLRSKMVQTLETHERLSQEPSIVRAMLVDELISKAFRQAILDDPPVRSDGRGVNEVRPIGCEVDVLPTVHGSSYFSRGDTHVLSTVTFGQMLDPRETVAMDGSDNQKVDHFILHYDFPPFCNGEVGSLMPNRRTIGHGNLAERALKSVMPPVDKFPYVVRLLADCTSSNGSSSMASVCGGTLALMEAGVPLVAPVAGVSVGLVTDSSYEVKYNDSAECSTGAKTVPVPGAYRLLTDILGSEDHHGDMDFKIAGTLDGITALQLDVKLPGGIPVPIIQEALNTGFEARVSILEKMDRHLTVKPMKDHSPRSAIFPVDPSRASHLLGNSAEVLKYVERTFGIYVKMTDDEKVYLFGKNDQNFEDAKSLVRDVATVVKAGVTTRGSVVDVKDFGVFVRVNQGQQALLHVSKISHDPRIFKTPLTEIFRPGDFVDVQVCSWTFVFVMYGFVLFYADYPFFQIHHV